MVNRARQSIAAKSSQAAKVQLTVVPNAAIVPTCPLCNADMLKRTARKGNNAGAEFWGCLNFPTCRGVRPLN
jgi:restriction system protein